MTSLPSERQIVAAVINPAAAAAGVQNSAWVSMVTFEEVMAVILAGALGVNGTIDAKLQQATDSSGTGAKDITGKAVTQFTQAGTDKSNKQSIINIRAEEMDRTNGFTHVRLVLTTAVATSPSAAVLIGSQARYAPANAAASVQETIK